MNFHINIIDTMQALGYSIDREGLCFGIASMARQAILVGELEVFDKRIKKIIKLCKNDGKNLRQAFDALKREDQLDLLAFFDGVAMYHSEPISSVVIQKKSFQADRTAMPFVTPEKLEGDPQILVKCACFAFKNAEIESWLNGIKEMLTLDCALELNSSSHMITISYDAPTDQWHLIDANTLPSQTISETYDLTQYIHQSFEISPKVLSENIIFDATLFTKASCMREVMDQLHFSIWDEMAEQSINSYLETDANGVSLLYTAARVGDVQLVVNLLEKGANVNLRVNEGWSPLHMAAQHGHIETVKTFIQKGANIDLPVNGGFTPLIVAALYAHLCGSQTLGYSESSSYNYQAVPLLRPYEVMRLPKEVNLIMRSGLAAVRAGQFIAN